MHIAGVWQTLRHIADEEPHEAIGRLDNKTRVAHVLEELRANAIDDADTRPPPRLDSLGDGGGILWVGIAPRERTGCSGLAAASGILAARIVAHGEDAPAPREIAGVVVAQTRSGTFSSSPMPAARR